MFNRIIENNVTYNDPDKMVVTKERYNKKWFLFGLRLFSHTYNLDQGFEESDNTNKIGY